MYIYIYNSRHIYAHIFMYELSTYMQHNWKKKKNSTNFETSLYIFNLHSSDDEWKTYYYMKSYEKYYYKC